MSVAATRTRRRRAGFTLIEVMGAFFLTTIVLLLVTTLFQENARQRSWASEVLRVEITSSTALDVVTQDLEAALYLTRPSTRDPRDHPWRFVAEDRGELGARSLRFQTQNVSRANLGEHATTWVDVAYFLSEEDDPDDATGGEPSFTLWRWRSSRPPSERDERLPDLDDPRTVRVAEGLADFGVRFSDLEGGIVDEWDSSFVADDAPLPVGVEVSVVLYREARPGEADPGVLVVPAETRARSVSLAMSKPVDVAALIELAGSGNDAECATIAQCADFDDAWFVELREAECDGDEELCALLNDSQSACWSEIVSGWPSVADTAAPECEQL